jgi:hypothetical protein
MPLPEHLVGKPEDMCSCGRIASQEHCPVCGTFKVHFMPSLSRGDATMLESKRKFFRCVKGHVFEDNGDAQARARRCEAPHYDTRIQRALMELNRTKVAIDNGHPLTQREENIAPVVSSEVSYEVKRKHTPAWVAYVNTHPDDKISLDDFAKKREEEEKLHTP